MTAKVIYHGGLRTTCIHERSKAEIVTDAPPDNRGRGEAFSPTDMCATSLASCAITVMGIYANDHGIDMDNTHATVAKIMGADPRRISQINIIFHMPAHLTEKERTILQRIAEHCPVSKSLHPDLLQNLTFVYDNE